MSNRLLPLFVLFFLAVFACFGQRSVDGFPKSNPNAVSQNPQNGITKVGNGSSSVEGKHQMSFFIGGGLSSFKYTPAVGKRKDGYGFTMGFDYSYYWHRKWGVTTGFMFDSFGSSLDLNGVVTRSVQSDGDIQDGAQNFTLVSHFNGLTEEQRSYLMGFPVLLKFRQPFSKKVGVMIGIGAKISVDLSSKSSVAKGSFSTYGHYPQYSGADSLNVNAIQGFTSYSPRNSMSSSVGVGISMLSDLALYVKINPAFILYGGPYFEYQVNKTASNPDQELVSYNVSNVMEPYCEFHPVLKSNVVEGANRLALGGKVGLIFDFGGYKILKKINSDKNAQRLAAEAASRAAEASRLAELRRLARADSLANALQIAEIRNKSVADSIAFAKKLAEEARRLAELKRLAELQRIKDSISSSKAHANDIAVIMDVRTKKLTKEELDLLKLPIVFKLGSADITDQSKMNAQRIGEMLSRHPDLAYQITGHTCDIGNDEANYRLGLRRAQTLFKEFSRAGVMSEQILTFSKGETQPLLPNINEENRKRNRRVVVVIEDVK